VSYKIKFRVWHKLEKRWLDPWAEEDPMLCMKDYVVGCEVYLYNRQLQEHTNQDCQMKDIVIQQYTGLKDKDGAEIYEGDILHTKHSAQSPLAGYDQDLRVVRRDPNSHQLQLFAVEEERWPASGFALSETTRKRFKVIGNIFQEEKINE